MGVLTINWALRMEGKYYNKVLGQQLDRGRKWDNGQKRVCKGSLLTNDLIRKGLNLDQQLPFTSFPLQTLRLIVYFACQSTVALSTLEGLCITGYDRFSGLNYVLVKLSFTYL